MQNRGRLPSPRCLRTRHVITVAHFSSLKNDMPLTRGRVLRGTFLKIFLKLFSKQRGGL